MVKRVRARFGLWALAFIGFMLLFSGWALSSPYDGPPDEMEHAMRAAAVAHGELLPSHGFTQKVPLSLYRPFCFEQHVEKPANCMAEPGGDSTLKPEVVSAAYYNPVYYWVTSWPVAVWPSWRGILLARLLTGAAMAAFLASAVVAACHWIRHRAVLAGLVVAATPMMAHLGGAINPNGVEITAGLALTVGLIALLHERPRGELNRAAVALVGTSAAVLAVLRSLGLMWVAVIVVALVVGTSREHLRRLVRERYVWRWSGVVALGAVEAVVWLLVAKPLDVPQRPLHLTVKQIVRDAVLDVWPNIANQMVGVPGWSEVLQPRLIYVVWFMAVGLLLFGGFALAGRVDRLRLILLFIGTFVPLLVEEMLLVDKIGWFNQGRYFLPGAVGLPILGAYVMANAGIDPTRLRSMTRMLAVVLVPIQFVVLAYTMTRYQSGLTLLNPLKGSWLPPHGPVLPLVLGALSVVVLIALFWRASRLPTAPPETGGELPGPEKTPHREAAFAVATV